MYKILLFLYMIKIYPCLGFNGFYIKIKGGKKIQENYDVI